MFYEELPVKVFSYKFFKKKKGIKTHSLCCLKTEMVRSAAVSLTTFKLLSVTLKN